MYRSLWILIAFLFAANCGAYERVVLLAPAAGDLFIRLGQSHKVVGVTRANTDFPAALQVGSHIKPNLELIKSLQPDLIVVGSRRFFTDEMSALVDADTLEYNPVTLDGVLAGISLLGQALECQQQAAELNHSLEALLGQIRPLPTAPRVVYEVTEMPLTIAGGGNIAADIVRAAGGRLLAPSSRKLVKYNVEGILMGRPDYYLYQVGPMNPAPTPPLQRSHYRRLSAQPLRVDQLVFSRANSRSFQLALRLNQRFLGQEAAELTIDL